MPGHRLCAGALLAALAFSIALFGYEGALQARPTFGRELSDLKVCRGQPSSKQQLRGEILDTMCEAIGKPGATFLVFGLGRDSPFWFDNTGGQITFLENHEDWAKFQNAEVRQRTHFVKYTHDISEFQELLENEAMARELLDSLPQDVKDTSWDVILVDSPMGYRSIGVPGRTQSMFAARELAHAGTIIFVDDYERRVESVSATKYLAPSAVKSKVYSNGHGGKTAMFVMAEGGGRVGNYPPVAPIVRQPASPARQPFPIPTTQLQQGRDKPMSPQMHPDEHQLFKRLLEESTTYFEWGSGGSTAWAVGTPSLTKIHTIENAVLWLNILNKREKVQEAVEEGRLTLTALDLGPTLPAAYPQHRDAESRKKWGSYSDQIFVEPDAHWDIILVDGRFRVPCALKALQHIKDRSTTRVVMHDYMPQRSSYRQVEEFADIVERVNTLVVFRKKAEVNAARLQEKVTQTEHDLQRL